RDSLSPFTGNAFWEEVGVYHHLGTVREAGIATYFWGNWRDEPTGQVILGAANLGSKFLAGPGDHCVPPAGFDFSGDVVRFFDHHLKGIDNGIEREPRATYFVEDGDGGRYVTSGELPGIGSRPLPWYLSPGPDDQASTGSLQPAPGQAAGHSFTVDYDLPPADYFAFWPGPMNEHGLNYPSAPLAEPLTLIGFPVAHLTVTSTHPDADLFVYLDLVAPDGKAEVISFGRLKLSHRQLAKAPYDTLGLPWHSGRSGDMLPLAPSEQAAVSIAMTPLARTLPPGSRLRFTVAGADPRQRNLPDIKQTPPPQISILQGGRDPSRIELPLAAQSE